MKVGIVGLGSIGRVHAHCLRDLSCRLAAVRTNRGALRDGLDFVEELPDVQALLAWEPEAAVVAVPTALHAMTALPLLEAGVPVLVEKPLAHSAAALEPLRPFASRVVTGYVLRFHPAYTRLRAFLESGRLGRACAVRFTRSHWLPAWHPHADYRREYAARRDLGGGVLRTLSHEIDLMHWLFGPAEEVRGAAARVSDLEIDVEDWAAFTCRLPGGVRADFRLDYLGPAYENRCEVFGTRGRAHLCFAKGRLAFEPHGGPVETLHAWESSALDDAYRAQMEDFLAFAESGISRGCSFEDGARVLRVVEAVEA